MRPIQEVTVAERTTAVVPLRLPSPSVDAPEDPRLSDVDEWGRSEHIRSIIRRIYDPIYSQWFRAEWEGLEKIPTDGGALLVANHAGAIPSDAPVIMHGIEKELGRPVYGMADYFFRTVPVVSTLWARAGGVAARPDNAYRLLHDQGNWRSSSPKAPRVRPSPSPIATSFVALAAGDSWRLRCGQACPSSRSR